MNSPTLLLIAIWTCYIKLDNILYSLCSFKSRSINKAPLSDSNIFMGQHMGFQYLLHM